ncbi:hypothetical protein ENSA5_18650 [Enhygromyxa salina]|uniref:Uncharacterized protein n=1 Tax=Enhygromyxa salina TaxID=215803 RepID=A0A2S9YD30_9BACT|nr:hypothetical protein [Enhygromyxa salina]PRQ02926.1 hypothetical protein ENSA5_18650 [Enhygromyxa salina]
MSEPSPTREQIERELVALGEASPNATELALLERELDDEPEVASMARLSELAEPLAFEDLSELETQRAWRKIEEQVGSNPDRDEAIAAPAASSPVGGSTRGRLLAVAGLAAAAVVLVIILPQEREQQAEGPSAKEVAELSEQVRSTLRLLDDGKTDTERAAALAADYERRLEEQGG